MECEESRACQYLQRLTNRRREKLGGGGASGFYLLSIGNASKKPYWGYFARITTT